MHFMRRRERRHSVLTAVLALMVISVILFPVISLTDDLNPVLFSVEDSTRRLSAVHGLAPITAVIVSIGLFFLLPMLVKVGTIAEDDPCVVPGQRFATQTAGRAPPFLS